MVVFSATTIISETTYFIYIFIAKKKDVSESF